MQTISSIFKKYGVINTLDYFPSISRTLCADLPYEVGSVVSNICYKSYTCMDAP